MTTPIEPTPQIRRVIEALAEGDFGFDNIVNPWRILDEALGLDPDTATFDDTATALRALLQTRDPERYTATCRSSDRAGSGLEVAHLLRVIAYALEDGEDVVDAIAQQYPTYVDPVRCAQWLCGVAEEAEDLVLLEAGDRVISAARRDPRVDPRPGDVLRWISEHGNTTVAEVGVDFDGGPMLFVAGGDGPISLEWLRHITDGIDAVQVLYVAPDEVPHVDG